MMGSIPWLGKVDSESPRYPYRAMHRLSQLHGPVMSVALGGDVWVVLTGLEAIKQFSMMDETTGRPNLPALNEIYSMHKDKPLGKKNY